MLLWRIQASFVSDFVMNRSERISQYRVMWVMVFFDLPTDTKKEVKAATEFRKLLISDGFIMFQYSIYLRHCASAENADVHIKRAKSFLPPKGKVGILRITDKQFAAMELFNSQKSENLPEEGVQLELFWKPFTLHQKNPAFTGFFGSRTPLVSCYTSSFYTNSIVFKERRYKIWKQFTTYNYFRLRLLTLCSKNEDTKSESNSQPPR